MKDCTGTKCDRIRSLTLTLALTLNLRTWSHHIGCRCGLSWRHSKPWPESTVLQRQKFHCSTLCNCCSNSTDNLLQCQNWPQFKCYSHKHNLQIDHLCKPYWNLTSFYLLLTRTRLGTTLIQPKAGFAPNAIYATYITNGRKCAIILGCWLILGSRKCSNYKGITISAILAKKS